MPQSLVYVDGKFVDKHKAVVSVFDHGLLYGDGVFEGIRAYGGSVFRLADHMARLYDSAKCLHLSLPLSRHEFTEAVLETLRKNRLKDAYIRVVVTRGAGDLGVDPSLCKDPTVIIIAEPMSTVLGPKEPRSVKLIVASVRRDPVDATTHEIKSLNYLNSILAKIEAKGAGVDDAILLDHRGLVSEASVTNIFAVKGGKVFTPSSAAGILHGITRERVIRLCSDLGIEVQERDVTPFELVTADEAFLVGTKAEILAVESVGGTRIGVASPGPLTKKIYGEFCRIVLRPEEGTPIYEAESVSL